MGLIDYLKENQPEFNVTFEDFDEQGSEIRVNGKNAHIVIKLDSVHVQYNRIPAFNIKSMELKDYPNRAAYWDAIDEYVDNNAHFLRHGE